ncbi:family 78 glycoside hydrolase catalytic domain [Microbacterium sp. X-17]|uniref:family 78 glycoside hydrolase catalytic domain n=1 Tax=Microbacterium sp. X-17 TaxID=3144404 RepID=UPI0031F5A7E9
MTWHARMIAADEDFDGAPHLRKEFSLTGGSSAVRSAELVLSAFGLVEAQLNGMPVSDTLLTPGWTSYQWRLRYARYDVTSLLDATNVLGLTLGNGWYRGRLTWLGSRALYGDELGGFAELTITYEDGSTQRIVSDDTWRSGPSAILANDIYDGETIDARLRDDAWLRPGFDDSAWRGVHELALDTSVLTPYIGPEVVRTQEVPARKIWTSPSGRTLVDFGQNLVGWVRVTAQGPAGTEIVLRHAEVLEHDELGLRPLRSARAEDRYVLSGGVDVFEPTFTFHGFRYAEVEGWPGELRPEDLTAVVVGSALDRIGTFVSSDPLLNQLHENVVWAMRGNFVDVPTDCPQRDERLGWTGDVSAFAPTAAYLFDVGNFLRDWLHDVTVEQEHLGGVIPFVIPDAITLTEQVLEFGVPDATAIWSDAGVWVPWALWQAYGDARVLEDQYGSMLAHVRRVESLLSPTGLWDTGFQFGDWLDPDAPPQEPALAKADPGVVATACAYRSATLVAETAALLGRPEHDELRALAARLRAAFTEHYVRGGIIRSDCATVYALAIVFDLLDPADLEVAGDRLSELVQDAGYRISTGFAGTPFVTDALTITGHLDDAYGLLLERACPSWLYPVTMGATTVWERWDSMLPDGSINPGQMTSFNHYALGAVADWMHRSIGGIAPLEPGYARILVAPRPGGGLTWASAALRTPHGPVSVDWRIHDDTLIVDVRVPEDTEAVVRLPGRPDAILLPGAHTLLAPVSDTVAENREVHAHG